MKIKVEERYLNSPLAYELYQAIAHLPLICPHGHVDPRLFAETDYQFGTPVDLLIIPDHYIFRMLYSQGITLESLGSAPRWCPRRDRPSAHLAEFCRPFLSISWHADGHLDQG